MVCVVLCAGGSSRFGKDKIFQKLCGKTLVERVVSVASKFGRVRVVVRPEDSDVVRSLFDGVEVVVNRNWREGISTSVKKGLDGVEDDALIFLCDMPLLSRRDVERFLEKAKERQGGIIHPVWKGKRGFPVFVRKNAVGYVDLLEGDEGFRKVCREFPDICEGIELEGEGYYVDVDTFDDLERLRRRCEDGVHELGADKE